MKTINFNGCEYEAGKYGSKYKGPPLKKDLRKDRANKKLGYLGNPKLKRADIKMKMTADEVEEYTKCVKSPIYFIRTYMKIVNIDGGLIPFDMFDFQEEMVHVLHDNRFSVLNTGRQQGKCVQSSTIINIKNKKTGLIKSMSIGEFHELTEKSASKDN